MTRQQSLLAGLAVVVVLVAWWMLLMSPRNTEVAEARAEVETVQGEQDVMRNRIRALESVRGDAPEIEADLAAAQTILPPGAGLPATLRQLQDAADQSGIVLTDVSPDRPSPVPEAPGIDRIDVSLTVSGGYYQWVDFLRRVEDPRLVGRGVLVRGVDLTPGEYPTLDGSVRMAMFAQEAVSPGAAGEAGGEGEGDATAEQTASGDDEISSDEAEGEER